MNYIKLLVFLLFSTQLFVASQKQSEDCCILSKCLNADIILRKFKLFDQYKFSDGTTIEKYEKGKNAGNVYVALPNKQAVQFTPDFTKIFLEHGTIVEKSVLTGIKKITLANQSTAEYRPGGSIIIKLANGRKYKQDSPELPLRLLPKKSVSFKDPEKVENKKNKQSRANWIAQIMQARQGDADDDVRKIQRKSKFSLYGSISKK